MVARHSTRLAETVERYLLIGDHPAQSAFAMPEKLAQSDPIVSAFEAWAREHLEHAEFDRRCRRRHRCQ